MEENDKHPLRKLIVKCRRCGEVCLGKEEFSYDFIRANARNVDVRSIHRCTDGGIGLTDVLGFETDGQKMKREAMEVLCENNPNII